MLLDLSKSYDLNKFKEYSRKLQEKGDKVELKKVSQRRSISQNSYFHVVITLYAMNYGSSIQEAKTDLKRDYGLFYEKNGKKYLRSSADLDTKEMTDFIDWIRHRAGQGGFYIHTSEEYLINKFEIDREINQNEQYL